MIRSLGKIFWVLIIVNYVDFANCAGYITVVGSKLIRSSVPYQVSVTSNDLEDSRFIISIDGKNDQGKDFTRTQNVSLRGSNTKNLVFDLHDILPGQYKLKAKSLLSGIEFDKSADLDVNTKKQAVFIQTDKSTYKASDKIQFRVLLLDADTKPVVGKTIKIFVTDGENNRIKQFLNAELKKGVFKNELLLSDSPVLGIWKINVELDGKIDSKEFEVAEYVLPKYQVTIDTPSFVTHKDGKFRVTVRAKYTYGKPVKGEVAIIASKETSSYSFSKPKEISKVIPVDGKGSIEFDLHDELSLNENAEETVNLAASFTEELTGHVQNTTSQIKVYKERTKLQIIKKTKKIKPGLPYSFTVKVLYQDNTPVIDEKNSVGIELDYGADDKTSKSYELENGMIKVDTVVPKNQQRLYIKATYLGISKTETIEKENSPSGEYIKAQIKTSKPKINENVEVEVQATENMKSISYTITGRGALLASDTIKISNKKSATFRFKTSFQMIPKASLVVYYVNSDGKMVSDIVDVEFSEELNNNVKLKTSPPTTKPGDNVTLSITSAPHSYIGLLGVDQSVLLLKKGNDLESSLIFNELDKYKTKDTKRNRRSAQFGFPPSYPYWPSPSQPGGGYEIVRLPDKFSHFDASEMVILTNSKGEPQEERRWRPVYFSSGGFGGGFDNGFGGYRPSSSSFGGFGGFGGSAANAAASAQSFGMGLSGSGFGGFAAPGLPGPPPRPMAPSNDVDDFFEAEEPEPELVTRKEFPETWIFDDIEDLGENGFQMISRKVPDTITSWYLTGFSLNSEYGLGLTANPTKLNVFQPFFMSTNLPYSIKRGEIVAISITVFNYMEENAQADVVLENEDNEYEFVGINSNGDQRKQVKKVMIKSNSGVTVNFMIKPLIVGEITIKATALSPLAGDKIEKQLLVEPEGITQYMNKAFFVDLRNDSEFIKNVEITVPANAIPDSTKIESAVIGDIMGPTMTNMDKLIKMPYGCGEQNMLNFVPNIVVLDYLTNLNQLKPETESKLKKYMETGYQKELTYKHSDGSYSAFGSSDKSGSTWLTAFVAKSFNQASKYIEIEKDIINQALDWLSTKQNKDGSFPEVGKILAQSMQGGSGKGVGLTAYTLIAFLENKNNNSKFKTVINKAINFIVNNSENLTDTYSLAIVSYALQLAKHESKDMFLVKLDNKSETKDGMKFWKRSTTEKSDSKPSSVDIEMTAYAMLTFIEAGFETEAVPIMKWLISQRNENGGFQSTQDTVVGLQALSKLAQKIYVPESNVEVFVENHGNVEAKMTVNKDNALVLQKHQLPPFARDITLKARGHGIVMVQISFRFNIDIPETEPRFIIDVEEKKSDNPNLLELEVCSKFVGDSIAKKSNMAVMEVSLPSGLKYDSDSTSDILKTPKIKKIETKNDDSVVMAYFDDFDESGNCLTLNAYRVHKVADQKPSSIIVYDYYDTTRRASTFYTVSETILCDICDDCETCLVSRQPISPKEDKKDYNYFTDVNRAE